MPATPIKNHNIELLTECAERAEKLFLEILPQIKNLALQDYENLNKLGILFKQLKNKNEQSI